MNPVGFFVETTPVPGQARDVAAGQDVHRAGVAQRGKADRRDARAAVAGGAHEPLAVVVCQGGYQGHVCHMAGCALPGGVVSGRPRARETPGLRNGRL